MYNIISNYLNKVIQTEYHSRMLTITDDNLYHELLVLK